MSYMVVMYFVMGHMFIAVLNFAYIQVMEQRPDVDAANSVTLGTFLEMLCPALSKEYREDPDRPDV